MTQRGLLLDLDGTLADSMPVMTRLYFEWVAEHGGQGSQAELESLNGVPLLEVMARLRVAHGIAAGAAELERAYVERIHAVYETVTPMAGGRELIDAARARGVRVAVVTGSSGRVARRWLARHGFADDVSAIVGGEDVTQGKPHPEPFLLGLERLGCVAARSIAVEDAPLGTRAALAAGLRTFIRVAPDDPREWPAVAGRVQRLDELIVELP